MHISILKALTSHVAVISLFNFAKSSVSQT